MSGVELADQLIKQFKLDRSPKYKRYFRRLLWFASIFLILTTCANIFIAIYEFYSLNYKGGRSGPVGLTVESFKQIGEGLRIYEPLLAVATLLLGLQQWEAARHEASLEAVFRIGARGV